MTEEMFGGPHRNDERKRAEPTGGADENGARHQPVLLHSCIRVLIGHKVRSTICLTTPASLEMFTTTIEWSRATVSEITEILDAIWEKAERDSSPALSRFWHPAHV